MRTITLLLLLLPTQAFAQNFICDPQFENCREKLRWYIQNEPTAIDVAFSYMSDLRYVADLERRHKEGLPIRILLNPDADKSKPDAAVVLRRLANSGIPIRAKRTAPQLHWKMMLFHGLGQVEFSKANYTAESFVPGFLEEHGTVKAGWFDEAPMFLNDPSVVGSFRTQFENYWTNTKLFVNYANSPDPPVRLYAPTPQDPAVNFNPDQNFMARLMWSLTREKVGIDLIEFRLLYQPAINALIAAHQRGVQVRIIAEPGAWGNPTYDPHVASIARLLKAGVPVKYRAHAGLTHEGLVLFHGMQKAVFGSANLSDTGMFEHNLFFFPGQGPVLSGGTLVYDWFKAQFERKWFDDVAFKFFQS